MSVALSAALLGTLLSAPAVAQPTDDVFFSEYVEGSSLNKALEIANHTGGPVDLGVEGYVVEIYFNGAATAGTTVPLAGVVADGDVFVLADDGAAPTILAVADQTAAASFFNGDDAIVLRRGGAVVDSFGQVGVDPGSEWLGGGQNDTLRRRCEVAPDTDPTDTFDVSAAWTAFPTDTFAGLGVSECDGGGSGPDPTPLLIHEVQGSGARSAYEGSLVAVEGVATALFEADDVLVGFFLQEQPGQADDDPRTSEGVLVRCAGECPDVSTGAVVAVSGTVVESFGMTEVRAASGDDIEVRGTRDLPPSITVPMPAPGSTKSELTFEAVEGMIVQFPDTLVVSEYFELARFGQVVLTEGSRPFQFTHVAEPDPLGYETFLADLETRRIVLDDDNDDQNDAISGPDADEPYPYPSPSWPTGGLSTSTPLRGGETIADLVGVLHWSFGQWRVRPIEGQPYSFEPGAPRADAPADAGSDLRVASLNVLNYFTTVDEPGAACGPSGLECRGADSAAELERQQAKIVSALVAMDADVVGLVEVENNDTAVQVLVDALNAQAGSGTYAQVDTGAIGTDAIKVGLIYRPATVVPAGPYTVLDSSVDPTFIDTKNRPVLIQTFTASDSGESFTAAVAHLKSKGSSCDDVGDPDTGDGQGNCSGTRTSAVQALTEYLATDPTGTGDADVLVLGDLNAYRNEAPIRALEDAGYVDLLESYVGDEAYTYLFDGQLGYLDHALASAALAEQVTGATAWHINVDEHPLLDYNDAIEDVNERWFERESAAAPLYEADPYRSSDHDPVVVGLDLAPGPAYQCAGTIYRVNALRAAGYTVVVGTDGKDHLVGTPGKDAIFGLAGDDHILPGLGDDLVCAGEGRDQVVAEGGRNTLYGEAGDDRVRGGMDDDSIDVGAGDDRAWGRKGNDVIDGGAGRDRAWGNQGSDTCTNVEVPKSCS